MTVRSPKPQDVATMGEIAQRAGLFPADLLPEMINPAFDGGTDVWLLAETENGAPCCFAFARAEELTDRVWNILALCVDPKAQGLGHASSLLCAMEDQLDARMIIIETTQLPAQAAARTFYEKAGYAREGAVRDFYAVGEDKVIYRKVLK